ncbi:MAG: hypothetical protein ACRC4M_04150 [Mycoplasma sp.]
MKNNITTINNSLESEDYNLHNLYNIKDLKCDFENQEIVKQMEEQNYSAINSLESFEKLTWRSKIEDVLSKISLKLLEVVPEIIKENKIKLTSEEDLLNVLPTLVSVFRNIDLNDLSTDLTKKSDEKFADYIFDQIKDSKKWLLFECLFTKEDGEVSFLIKRLFIKNLHNSLLTKNLKNTFFKELKNEVITNSLSEDDLYYFLFVCPNPNSNIYKNFWYTFGPLFLKDLNSEDMFFDPFSFMQNSLFEKEIKEYAAEMFNKFQGELLNDYHKRFEQDINNPQTKNVSFFKHSMRG